MDYMRILSGNESQLDIFSDIITCLEDVNQLPDKVKTIYRQSAAFDEETLDHFRFALIRLQVHSDIHRYEDIERTQQTKYIAQVLEKIVFGSLTLMEHEEPPRE